MTGKSVEKMIVVMGNHNDDKQPCLVFSTLLDLLLILKDLTVQLKYPIYVNNCCCCCSRSCLEHNVRGLIEITSDQLQLKSTERVSFDHSNGKCNE